MSRDIFLCIKSFDRNYSFIKYNGQFVSALPLKSPLPDPDDEAFLEVAIAGNVRYLITGNIVHYPSSHR